MFVVENKGLFFINGSLLFVLFLSFFDGKEYVEWIIGCESGMKML